MAATPQERLALGVAGLLLAAGAAARVFAPGPAPAELTGPAAAEASVSKLTSQVQASVDEKARRDEPLRPDEKFDINTVSETDLARMIGDTRAKRIIDYRRSVGRIGSLQELNDNVSSIGEGTIEKMEPHLLPLQPSRELQSARPSFQSAASVADWDRSPQKASRERSAAAGGIVDLNTASAAELTLLPGIGDALARRIVDWRQAHGGFRSVDQLLDVSGIGPAKLEALRPRVRATP
jgi:competence ComEA-like helix-hairpin-helix protein